MKDIRGYKGDQSVPSEASNGVFREETDLNKPRARKFYLTTCSQANFDDFPGRDCFVRTVLKLFEVIPLNVLQWICVRESQNDLGRSLSTGQKS